MYECLLSVCFCALMFSHCNNSLSDIFWTALYKTKCNDLYQKWTLLPIIIIPRHLLLNNYAKSIPSIINFIGIPQPTNLWNTQPPVIIMQLSTMCTYNYCILFCMAISLNSCGFSRSCRGGMCYLIEGYFRGTTFFILNDHTPTVERSFNTRISILKVNHAWF